MAKRLVVGLDPTDFGRAAARAACELAASLGASVTGIAIIDHPGIERATAADGAIGAGEHSKRAHDRLLERAEGLCRDMLAAFEHEGRVYEVRTESRLESGKPAAVLERAAIGADLLVMGTRTHFHFETTDRADRTLDELLYARLVPVLAVPASGFAPTHALMLYDGSAEAVEALESFLALTEGLESARDIVLFYAGDAAAGADLLAEPARVLGQHGRRVQTRIESGEPGPTALRIAVGAQPAWVVAGASKRGRLRQRLLGGVTRSILDDGHLPLLVAA